MLAIHSHVDGDELVVRIRDEDVEVATMRVPLTGDRTADLQAVADEFDVAVFGHRMVAGLTGVA